MVLERAGIKYSIMDEMWFSIQQLQRTGVSRMPRPHTHTAYELYYLLHGERVYFMNGGVYTAQKGDMVIVIPNDLHATASSEVAEFERLLVNFSPEFVSDSDRFLLELPPFRESTLIRFPRKEQAEVERLLTQMLTECKERCSHWDTAVRQMLTELLIRIHRTDLAAQNPPSSHPMHQKVSEIASFIQRHYKQRLSLEDTAARFFISPSYLSRIFLKLTGLHFSEYIRVVRIRESQHLLRTTKLKVQAIAEQVGFEHISHFNKTFKKIAGVSPLHYREQNKR